MEEEPAKPWPRNLSNAQLATQLETTPACDLPNLLLEVQRRQALDFLRSHVDTDPQ